jgi:hypothetical protein
MTDGTLKFPRGSVIEFSSGEYSDYGTVALVVTTEDTDLPALAKIYAAEERAKIKKRKGQDWEKPNPNAFPSWLIAKGHALPVTHTEVHLGSYGHFSQELGVNED